MSQWWFAESSGLSLQQFPEQGHMLFTNLAVWERSSCGHNICIFWSLKLKMCTSYAVKSETNMTCMFKYALEYPNTPLECSVTYSKHPPLSLPTLSTHRLPTWLRKVHLDQLRLYCTETLLATRVVCDCVLMWLLKDVGVNLGSHFLWSTTFLSLMRVCVIIQFYDN